MPIKFKTPYNDTRKRVTLDCSNDPPLVEQAHKDRTDLNWLVRKYDPDLIAASFNNNRGFYAEFSAEDFQNAQNILINGQAAFDELPASLRNQFENNPVLLLDFLDDPANAQAARDLGLLVDAEQPAPAPEEPPVEPSADPQVE